MGSNYKRAEYRIEELEEEKKVLEERYKLCDKGSNDSKSIVSEIIRIDREIYMLKSHLQAYSYDEYIEDTF